MSSSGMLRRVALVRTDVSEELSASFMLLVTASVVRSSPILVTPMKEAPSSSETSVLTITTRRNIPEYTILQNIYGLCSKRDVEDREIKERSVRCRRKTGLRHTKE
jgi:hypothetical protein